MRSRKPTNLRVRSLMLTLGIVILTGGFYMLAEDPLPEKTADEDIMSAMGRVAQTQADERDAAAAGGIQATALATGQDDDNDGPLGGQAETSLAVDPTGMHIVIGFNDTRGFSLNPASVSGFRYSDDGGVTFVDGGQLPVTTGTSAIGTTLFPQVFGDPEVKYVPGGGGCQFVYFSIVVKKFSTTGTAQTMGVHRSTDCGHTWTGPFEVTTATNPHGLLSGVNARDAADKEFADVDPETGRALMSWSNFTSTAFAPGGVEISATFSDNIFSATPPTWSARKIVAAASGDGQASIPRFVGGGSSNVYVVWRRTPVANGNNVGYARSTDNGANWSPAVQLTTNFFTMDQVPGNDRVNTSPSLAVDNSGGTFQGNVYVVYSNNSNHDGADVAFQRSIDGGLGFSAPVILDSRPGADRAQWFPWVTVDTTTGRVYVHYYDQGIAASGDLTETTFLYSDDGGVTWSKPMAMSDRPYHAGWGNDTGQPNLGDYNQSVAQGGQVFATWAGTELKGFLDQQPVGNFSTPDVFFKRAPATKISLSLGGVTFTETGGNGFIDAGETVSLKMPLLNYVTNPISAGSLTRISGTLSTSTAGVSVTQASSDYPDLAAGASALDNTDYVLQLSPSFVKGTHIELALNVSSDQGTTTLLFTQSTGTPETTTLLNENFDAATAPALPAGWSVAHGGGLNTVPWVTNGTFFGTTSNAAFHQNAQDGSTPTADPTRWERLLSPVLTVPAAAEYMTVDMDVAYDTEDDPSFNIQAFDGFFLRLTDQTTGRVIISALAEAWEEEFTTDGFLHYPKHLPRNSSTRYFEDMSCWAGDSQGFKHVHMKFPGAGGLAGARVQLRFEFTQDSSFNCANVRPGHQCGVMVDNVVVKSVVSGQADLSLTKTVSSPTVLTGDPVTYAISVSNGGPSASAGVVVSDSLSSSLTFTSCSSTGSGVCGGSGNSRTAGFASLASSGTETVTLGATVNCNVPDGTIVSNTAAVGAATPDNDPANNTGAASFTVVNPPPVIACPSDISTVNAPGLCSAPVSFPAPTATDNCGAAMVTTDIASGSSFPVGTTTVHATATDAAGATATCSFKVTVVDTTPPSITCPADISAVNDPGLCSAVVTYPAPTATDNCGAVTVATDVASGSVFPVGGTTVHATATDAAGRTSSCSFNVTVADNEPPAVAVSLSPERLWPPNHQMVTVDATVTSFDNCGATTCTLTSVSSSEPDNATGNGDGNTTNDIQNAAPGTLDLSFDFRAERAGTGQGRLYTAGYTCVDIHGNPATSARSAFVPHDQSGVEDPMSIEMNLVGADPVLSWNAVGGAEYYSVIRGNVAQLSEQTNFLNLGAVDCLEPRTLQTSRLDTDTPAPGKVFFYLVAYHHGLDSTYGTPSASKPRVPGRSCP
ncbi:MAG: HYR domain-containing protein [Acidobacteria bacterium]|nr:HYR domain-containing protein [Acidobacteriota bacterium]